MLCVAGCDEGAGGDNWAQEGADLDVQSDSLAAMGRPKTGNNGVGNPGGQAPPNGKKLFEDETFDGNGRTCQTCHSKSTGTLSLQQIQDAFAEDPAGPLFRSIDSDDGLGESFDRLLTHGTIRVTLPLPPGWSLVDDPEATEVTVLRGIPTTLNVALDDIFMVDARVDNLEDQALGAVLAHAEPGRLPTPEELAAIADFETSNKFFSNNELKQWANGVGPAPQLPPGNTESEIRGRTFFAPGGVCAFCHSGPMLNETDGNLPFPPLPPGVRVFTAFVSELNMDNHPVQTFAVANDDGSTTIVQSPDPGRALITGDLADLNLFRTPTLWGIKDTAPYFHDNSSDTLEELMDHYNIYFQLAGLPAFSEQDLEDMVNYMKLL